MINHRELFCKSRGSRLWASCTCIVQATGGGHLLACRRGGSTSAAAWRRALTGRRRVDQRPTRTRGRRRRPDAPTRHCDRPPTHPPPPPPPTSQVRPPAFRVLHSLCHQNSGVTSHRQHRQCRGAQGSKTVKGAQSDPNYVSGLLLDCK